jgi:predicted nucleic acid-binding protein
MKRYIIDASVGIKWFIPEIHSESASRLLQDGKFDLFIPDLFFAEIGNVLWKKEQKKEITHSIANQILTEMAKFPLEIFPTQKILNISLEIATGLNRSFYDSLYLALAQITQGQMVTADKKFYNAISATPFNNHVLWVEDL